MDRERRNGPRADPPTIRNLASSCAQRGVGDAVSRALRRPRAARSDVPRGNLVTEKSASFPTRTNCAAYSPSDVGTGVKRSVDCVLPCGRGRVRDGVRGEAGSVEISAVGDAARHQIPATPSGSPLSALARNTENVSEAGSSSRCTPARARTRPSTRGRGTPCLKVLTCRDPFVIGEGVPCRMVPGVRQDARVASADRRVVDHTVHLSWRRSGRVRRTGWIRPSRRRRS
jgi:hypothetical protein